VFFENERSFIDLYDVTLLVVKVKEQSIESPSSLPDRDNEAD
jgi:hypothetical protein